jgi:hypothetical protein
MQLFFYPLSNVYLQIHRLQNDTYLLVVSRSDILDGSTVTRKIRTVSRTRQGTITYIIDIKIMSNLQTGVSLKKLKYSIFPNMTKPKLFEDIYTGVVTWYNGMYRNCVFTRRKSNGDWLQGCVRLANILYSIRNTEIFFVVVSPLPVYRRGL